MGAQIERSAYRRVCGAATPPTLTLPLEGGGMGGGGCAGAGPASRFNKSK